MRKFGCLLGIFLRNIILLVYAIIRTLTCTFSKDYFPYMHNSRSRHNFFELIQIDFEEVFVGPSGRSSFLDMYLSCNAKEKENPLLTQGLKSKPYENF